MQQLFTFIFVHFITPQQGRQHSLFCWQPVITPILLHRLYHITPFLTIYLYFALFIYPSCRNAQFPQAFPKYDLAWLVPQYLPWIIIYPVFGLHNLRVRHRRKVRSLGKPPPNHAVCILVGASLPRGIRVAEIHFSPGQVLVDARAFQLLRRRATIFV